MAKGIDLTGDDQNTPAQPETPPSASQVRQGPPLPQGRAIDPSKLTETEREQLKAQGWQEGDPVPDVDRVEQEAQQDLQQARQEQPADESAQQSVQLNPTPVEQLSDDERSHYEQLAQNAVAGQSNTSAPRDPSEVYPESEAGQAVNSAHDVGAPERLDTDSQPHDQSQTQHLEHCPHCGWDLAIQDDVEVTESDKQEFLQAILGHQTFVRTYPLFNGRLRVSFRTLATREVDAIYNQVYAEYQRNEFSSELDFMERVNRLRLFLQLQALQSEQTYELPDGFTPQTNPGASAHWKFPENTQEPLKLVEDYVFNNLLTTEVLDRLARRTLARFNRLVGKLEDTVDNSDFWGPTGSEH